MNSEFVRVLVVAGLVVLVCSPALAANADMSNKEMEATAERIKQTGRELREEIQRIREERIRMQEEQKRMQAQQAAERKREAAGREEEARRNAAALAEAKRGKRAESPRATGGTREGEA